MYWYIPACKPFANVCISQNNLEWGVSTPAEREFCLSIRLILPSPSYRLASEQRAVGERGEDINQE